MFKIDFIKTKQSNSCFYILFNFIIIAIIKANIDWAFSM